MEDEIRDIIGPNKDIPAPDMGTDYGSRKPMLTVFKLT